MAANEEWEGAEAPGVGARHGKDRVRVDERRVHTIAGSALSATWISRIMNSGWPTQAR